MRITLTKRQVPIKQQPNTVTTSVIKQLTSLNLLLSRPVLSQVGKWDSRTGRANEPKAKSLQMDLGQTKDLLWTAQLQLNAKVQIEIIRCNATGGVKLYNYELCLQHLQIHSIYTIDPS
jgi:hypothetical protein